MIICCSVEASPNVENKLSSSSSLPLSASQEVRDEKKDVHRLLNYWKQRESFGFVKIPDIEFAFFLFFFLRRNLSWFQGIQ